jgi:hypothetical protein
MSHGQVKRESDPALLIKVERSSAVVLTEGLAQPNDIDIAYDLRAADRSTPQSSHRFER